MKKTRQTNPSAIAVSVLACAALALSPALAHAQTSGNPALLAAVTPQPSLPDAPEPQQQQDEKKPPPPASSGSAPSLDDLGITATQSHGDDRTQALLDRRSHMLKVHTRLGLITGGKSR